MIGRKLGNRYEVIERIGGGGMAVVYRALDTLLNRNVSIKVLRAQFSTDEEFVRRFRREAQAAASLSHPNVVNIYDVGMENEEYYIVMEYVDGLTLKEVIQERAPLPVGEAIDIAKQICAALGHAHDNNIVHRDIKPHNILIGKDGRVKVTDFGIARAITSNTITQDGSVLGSVHYFSPEQARGGITDVKSDIYSLGVVLYEMVTGELPFSGETPISVALKHLQDHFVEPRQINPALPQSVENIVLKSLAKNPLVRYQSAREMARDLDKALLYPNVPKFTVPLFDEQQTIQMPAVGVGSADSLPRSNGTPQVQPESTPEETTPAEKQEKKPEKVEKENKPKKKKKFWKPVIWLVIVLILLVVGAITAYTIVTNYMGAKDVVMPNEVGKNYDTAVQDLVKAGLSINNIHKNEEHNKDAPNNTVIRQDQYPGKTIKANRDITLTVSLGPDKVSMPSVTQMSQDQAMAALKAQGIPAANIQTVQQEDKNDAAGTVLSQSPDPNTQIDPTTPIKLTVAKAPVQVKVPDVTNATVDSAKQQLTNAGLTVGQIISSQSADIPSGHVIKTSPVPPGTLMNKGDTIDLFVSTGDGTSDSGSQGNNGSTGGSTGTSTSGSGQDNGPKKVIQQVTVTPPTPGQKVTVKIVRNDARGANNVVDADPITQAKTYTVECYVEKDHMASIEVYLDGSLSKTIPVPYQ